MQEEDSKDEDSYNEDARGGAGQGDAYLTGKGLESGRTNEDAANQYLNHYQTQQYSNQRAANMHKNIGGRSFEKQKSQFNVFSNSFDETAPSFDLRPERNCKSSTRMMNKTQKQRRANNGGGPQFAIPLMHNLSTGAGGGLLTAGSMNRK